MNRTAWKTFVDTVHREAAKCSACGECRMVCPVYGATGLERNVARGRLALAEALADGSLLLTPEIARAFESCLLCMACVRTCSGQVNMVDVVLKARACLSSRKIMPDIQTLAFQALTADRKYRDMGATTARKAQAVFMSGLPETSGLRLKLTLPRFKALGERLLPGLTPAPFISGRDQTYPALGQKRSVILFVGCASNYIYTDIAETSVQVLHHLGIGVIVPSGQCCCGAPVQARADTRTLRRLAGDNLRCLSGQPGIPILTLCASGGLMLKRHYPDILAGTALDGRAEEISRRTMDITEYLTEEVGLERIRSRIRRTLTDPLTYHDPCHLRHGQGVVSQPRAILRAICDQFLEMPNANGCCGLGGTYGLSHADLSMRILTEKTKKIAEMNPFPLELATGCPGCIMQLTHGCYQAGLRIRVRHTVQYLWQAMAEQNLQQTTFASRSTPRDSVSGS